MIKAVGIFLAIGVVILLVILILFCFRVCAYSKYSVFSCYMRLKNKVFYNMLIRFSLQSYLKTFVASCTTINLIVWSDSQSMNQGASSIAIVTVLVLLPFIYVYVMCKNSVHLALWSKKERIGSLYVNMNEEKGIALAYSIIFLFRRCFFVFVTFQLTSYAHLQIQLWVLSNVLYLSYLSNDMLFEERLQSRLEMLNELLFLGLCYHMVLLSNIITEYAVRDAIGWSFIYGSVCLVAINILILFYLGLSSLLQKCRLKLL